MSHVATVQLEVKDLDALKTAAAEIGCEFVENQTTYRWFGRHVGDYPLPTGFQIEDLGKCQHAIRIKDGPGGAYEVGVVKNPTGEGYVLLWDFWSGGKGLQAVIGENGNRLRQSYATEVAIKQLRKAGKRVQKKRLENGSIQLVATR